MRLLIATILAVALGLVAGVVLKTSANPEVAFWMEVVERRDKEIESARSESPGAPVIFFTGGSSCAFSIDPSIIEAECGLSAFNLGLPYAAGGEFLVDQAFRRARPGDYLIVALEPDSLGGDGDAGSPSPLSVSLSLAMGDPASAGGGEFGRHVGAFEHLNLTRPGAKFLATFTGRMVLRKPYRYSMDDWRYRGRLETGVRDAELEPITGDYPERLGSGGVRLLELVVEHASKKGVHVAYSMPWQFTSEAALQRRRMCARMLLEDIERLVPVLEDGFLGCNPDPTVYSDTNLHLNSTGSVRRSRAIAPVVAKWIGEP